MTDKEIIREQANIDISNLHIAQEQGIITEFGKGKLEALEGIVDFIDSLQEEPVSKDLEKAAVEAFKQIVDSGKNNFLEIFKAGAKWQKEQMMKDAIDTKEVDFNDEINKWQGCEAFPEGVGITPLPKAMEIVERTAKHFFELGCNNQKNE